MRGGWRVVHHIGRVRRHVDDRCVHLDIVPKITNIRTGHGARVCKAYEVLIIQPEAHIEAWQRVDVGRFVGVGRAAAVGEGNDVWRQIAAGIDDNVRQQGGTAGAVCQKTCQIRRGWIGDTAVAGFVGPHYAHAHVAHDVDVSEDVRLPAAKVQHQVGGVGLFVDMLHFGGGKAIHSASPIADRNVPRGDGRVGRGTAQSLDQLREIGDGRIVQENERSIRIDTAVVE